MSTISEQEYVTRIAALERLNKSLAEQVDRMAKVVDAARGMANDPMTGRGSGPWLNLRHHVRAYDLAMTNLAKGDNHQ